MDLYQCKELCLFLYCLTSPHCTFESSLPLQESQSFRMYFLYCKIRISMTIFPILFLPRFLGISVQSKTYICSKAFLARRLYRPASSVSYTRCLRRCCLWQSILQEIYTDERTAAYAVYIDRLQAARQISLLP